MKSLRRLALVADLVAFAVVSLGSWTRINAAGLTCPDWPTCHGQLVPSLGGGTLWEWTHRLLALALAPLVIAIVVQAFRLRRESTLVAPAALIVAVLFAVQVGLGAATVDLDNTPYSVVLHWGTAMMLIASLLALAIFANEDLRRDAEGFRTDERLQGITSQVLLLSLTVLVTFVTMCIGAWVSSSGAGLACTTIPGCAGNVLVDTQGQIVQMLHRFAAAATLLGATASCALVWARRTSAPVRVATSVGVVLVFVQVILGLLNVALRLPTDLREVHAANAALVFLAFVTATAFALLESPLPRSLSSRGSS